MYDLGKIVEIWFIDDCVITSINFNMPYSGSIISQNELEVIIQYLEANYCSPNPADWLIA